MSLDASLSSEKAERDVEGAAGRFALYGVGACLAAAETLHGRARRGLGQLFHSILEPTGPLGCSEAFRGAFGRSFRILASESSPLFQPESATGVSGEVHPSLTPDSRDEFTPRE